MSTVPHVRVVVAFCIVAIGGYLAFSIWIFGWTNDAALRGDVAGTWKSFAVLAFGFWLGSSSGGKAKPDPSEPQPVEVKNPPSDPVPVVPPAPDFAHVPEEPKP